MNNEMAINTYLSMIESQNKTNEQKRNRIWGTENILAVAVWEGVGVMGEKGEEIKKYKLVVIGM